MPDRRVCAVTGASRGIGRAIAIAFGEQRAAVACLGRDEAALVEVARLVEKAGGTASVHVGDVTQDETAPGFIEAVVAEHGALDVLVNNAGGAPDTPAQTTPPSRFRQVLDLNVVSCFAMAQAAYPYLRHSPNAVIVNVGSLFASLGVSRMSAYSASKAAVEGLTRGLANEWAADGIRVVCLAPGYVRSDISKDVLADERARQEILRHIPQRRVAEPEEVADFVAFLADPRAGFVTGSTHLIDGGQLTSW